MTINIRLHVDSENSYAGNESLKVSSGEGLIYLSISDDKRTVAVNASELLRAVTALQD